MTPDLITFLTSGAGSAEVTSLVQAKFTQHDVLHVITQLRTRYSADQASAMVDTALLRIRARAKFPAADLMLFDRDGLEQASAYPVARQRVDRLAAISPDVIVDLGCGLGGDAMAMTHLAPVVGVDIEDDRLRLARHNCRVAGGPNDFHALRSNSMVLHPINADVVFADPARRHGDRRFRGLDSYFLRSETSSNVGADLLRSSPSKSHPASMTPRSSTAPPSNGPHSTDLCVRRSSHSVWRRRASVEPPCCPRTCRSSGRNRKGSV